MLKTINRFYEQMGRPIAFRSRWVLGLTVLPLALSVTQPLWNLRMKAPQYPQGLELEIYAHTIQGGNEGRDLAEINTLNHYIGMKKLERADFTDLDWIPFAIGALCLLTLRVAAIGDIRSLIDLTVLTLYFGAFSAARFAYQLYNYGHDLDPRAPVTVDPFMPPLFGTQQIGNFSTTSFPGGGSYLLGFYAAVVSTIAIWHVLRSVRRATLATP